MLNRAFFENEFPGAVKAFCEQNKCDKPVFELVLYSGQTFRASNILKIEDRWLQVEVLTEYREPAQAFIPYKNIARLSMYSKMPPKSSVGF